MSDEERWALGDGIPARLLADIVGRRPGAVPLEVTPWVVDPDRVEVFRKTLAGETALPSGE